MAASDEGFLVLGSDPYPDIDDRPVRSNGPSRRGIRSRHHVREIDHRLGGCDLPHQERDNTKPAVAFP